MATEKIVNYTAAQVTELVSAYSAEPTKATVEKFAAAFAKSTKSIVAKLAKEGVYISAVKAAGAKRDATKAELVAEITKLVGSKDLESLEKATGPALKAVLARMTDLAEQVVAARAAAVTEA
jgi:hypothetical protein